MYRRRVLPSLLFLAICQCAFSAAPAWPRFRGNNGAGLADQLNLPTQITAANIKWRTKLPGEGHSSPAIAGERAFVTCAEKTSGQRALTAISTKDGKILWEKDFDGPVFRQHADNSFASATPALDAERVFVLSYSPESSWLGAFSQSDGREIWKKDLGPYVSQHGPGVSPIVWEDLVIVDFDQDQPKSFLAAFDTKTGAEKWRWEKEGTKHSSSTPCVVRPKNGAPQIVVISHTVGMSAIDARSGKLAWQLAGLFPKRCVASPIVTDAGLVIGQCGEGRAESFVYAVQPADDGKSAEKKYDVIRVGGYVPTPVAAADYLYLWKEDGLVTCLRAANNEQVWSERVQGPFYGSPIIAGGKLYNVTRRGELVVLAAGETFKEIERFALGEGSHASPAVSGGKLFIHTFNELVCLGE
jgi:outer membrane protein assembly factor BamB